MFPKHPQDFADDNAPDYVVQLRYDHFEKKRQAKINLIKSYIVTFTNPNKKKKVLLDHVMPKEFQVAKSMVINKFKSISPNDPHRRRR